MTKTPYPLKELISRWEREDLTVEQAIGQIMLWLSVLSAQLQAWERANSATPTSNAEETQ